VNLLLGLGAISGFVAVNSLSVYGEASGKPERPRMTVALCDRVGMDNKVWLTARDQINKIFDHAAIDVAWIDPQCEPRSAIETGRLEAPALRSVSKYFMVVIAPKPPADWPAPDAMGFAPIRTGPFPRAYVFYNLVEEFVERYGGPQSLRSATGIVLGHCIAHELGHLLIPEHAHGNGLMRDFWQRWEWQMALTGNLRFSSKHARQMQRQLKAN
jgi:hypothetical protein